MNDKAFVDTNILIYIHSSTDISKRQKAIELLGGYNCTISIQVLNEFCNVCVKKVKLPYQKIQIMLDEILETCELSPINESSIRKALILQDRYKFSFYDSLIISSALENDCKYLLSEDLANKQEIEGLIIKNIFVV
jgi:predicted nucleic acid-binding protein